MTNPTRLFPAIVEELLTKVANYGQSRDDSMYFEAFDLKTPEQAAQAILQAVRQLIKETMPEKKQIATKYPSGFDKGFNQALDEYRSNLLAALEKHNE